MNALQKIWGAVTFPLVAIAVLLDESRRQNLDGSWDEYNARRNLKERGE